MNGLRNQVIAMQAKLDELEAEKKKDKETIYAATRRLCVKTKRL